MNVTANGHSLFTASQPVVRAFLDAAAAKEYYRGVLGVLAVPVWEGPDRFTHAGRDVHVVPCPSTLAVWEALRERGGDGWLVILTPRDADDLGAGVITHFVWNRLRTPDPWQAVQQRFAAASLDPALYQHDKPREVAAGLLAAMPGKGWPPAPGGVLTREHALDAVVRTQLGLVERGVEVDITAVLEWSLNSSAPAALADLRALVGDALTEAVIDWLAGRCGLAEAPVRALLHGGRVADLVPLGLIAGLLGSDDPAVARAAGQFEGIYGLGRVQPDAMVAWHEDAKGLVTQSPLVSPETARRVVNTATTRLRELDISELAETSDLLPAGLQRRLADLAHEIHVVLPAGVSSAQPDASLVTASLVAAEAAWEQVQEHHLAATDDTARAFEAGLRLVRWLATDVSAPDDLGTLVDRQVAVDAWVDSALNDAMSGSADPQLAEVLGMVLGLTRLRRDAHDIAFGAALADIEEPDQLVVERLLPDQVIPMAGKRPVLLVVIDGLSVAVATELIGDATRLGWVEHGLPGRDRRAGALAVLPTLTEFSRCSLLCGELRQGSDDVEKSGFAELVKRSGLGASSDVAGGLGVPLFHQKQLDTVPPGQALAPQTQTVIADTENRRLVAAVLNTVDDTLHHTDPGGTAWTLATIRHLRPLLDAARRADRTVVVASDHGHVIERRNGALHRHDATYGARGRADEGEIVAGEVRVRGSRVLTGDGTAVLAVDERVRYGSLAAGYHGGGSPAEVVVPVIVLHAGDAPAGAELVPLGEVQPPWWRPTPVVAAPTPEVRPVLPASAEPDEAAATLARSVVSSKTFKRQRSIAGRIPVTDEKIIALLTSLFGAPDRRIPAQKAAAELGIAVGRLRGALPLLKRVLDVEGYVVLRYEPKSADVVLDEAMLREQFGLVT